MKMNKLTKVAMLGLVAASLASASALAQDVVANSTDLVLGFQITDGSGTGSASDLEVDLGSSANFTTATTTLTLGQLSVADLIATYGSNWATRGDLTFGVAGVTGNAAAEQFDVTNTQAVLDSTQSGLTVPHNQIGNLVNTLESATQTANSAQAGVIGNSTAPATGIGNSWSNLVGNGNGNGNAADFGYFNPIGSTEVNTGGNGIITDTQLDLYQLTAQTGRNATTTPAEELGYFDLSSTGVLTYTGIDAQAVPEPSAYALGICAVLLFLVLKRRHSVA